MISLTQHLRDEHREQLPHVEMLRALALYGLYAIVKVHFAKEEEIYLPILEARLTPEEAARMFEEMELKMSV